MRGPAMQLFLVVILLGAGAVITFWWAPSQILTGWATESWPAATGEIAQVERYESHSAKSGTTYYTRLHYRYAVDGKRFSGTRYAAAGDPGGSRSDRDAFAARYEVGSEVQVFYDPDKPASAVLARGVGWKSWGNLVMGLACLLGGGWFLFRLLRKHE